MFVVIFFLFFFVEPIEFQAFKDMKTDGIIESGILIFLLTGPCLYFLLMCDVEL